MPGYSATARWVRAPFSALIPTSSGTVTVVVAVPVRPAPSRAVAVNVTVPRPASTVTVKRVGSVGFGVTVTPGALLPSWTVSGTLRSTRTGLSQAAPVGSLTRPERVSRRESGW
ncbi:hypothetical protein Nm8I071_48460 [Nonomuraea sp. TT08I-71]|nr:hypothetical protein Nm8I071_48460 [Nonomuraea sp. TT08I-71]